MICELIGAISTQCAPSAAGTTNALATRPAALKSFVGSGRLPESDDLRSFQPYAQPMPVLAYDFAFALEAAQDKPVSRYLVLAYDDEFSVEYLNRRLHPYWRRKGDGVAELLTWAVRDYASLEDRCARFDATLITDLKTVGGEEYARLVLWPIRQAIAAHKLVADSDGTPLFFSKGKLQQRLHRHSGCHLPEFALLRALQSYPPRSPIAPNHGVRQPAALAISLCPA